MESKRGFFVSQLGWPSKLSVLACLFQIALPETAPHFQVTFESMFSLFINGQRCPVFWREYHLRNVCFLGTLSKKKPFVVNISDLFLEPFSKHSQHPPPQKKPQNSLKVSWREDWRDRKRTWRQGWEKPTQLSPTEGQRQAKWTKGIAKGKSRVT